MSSKSTHLATPNDGVKQPRAKVYKPPQEIPDLKEPSVFLAGSIEMGAAEMWQEAITEHLKDLPITILNPRRDDWDSSWEQRKRNPQFNFQVKWELEGQRRADLIAMYIQPGTNSQITLLELGLFANTGKLLVCCPDGFGRKGNVEIVCEDQNIPLVETWEAFVEQVTEKLKGLTRS